MRTFLAETVTGLCAPTRHSQNYRGAAGLRPYLIHALRPAVGCSRLLMIGGVRNRWSLVPLPYDAANAIMATRRSAVRR